MPEAPSYHDADLLLRTFDLRRESRLRAARDAMMGKYSPKDFPPDAFMKPSAATRAWGMVWGYWEMVCALIEKGLLNEDLFNSCTAEHVFLYFRYRGVIEAMRQQWQMPEMAQYVEKVARRHPHAAQFEAWTQEAPQPSGAKKARKPKGKAKTAR